MHWSVELDHFISLLMAVVIISFLWIFNWIRIRIPTRIQSGSRVFIAKNWREKTQPKNFSFFFFIQNCNLYIPGLHKGRPSYRRSLKPSKENIQHIQKWNLLTFLFLWVIFALLDKDPDPDCESRSRYGSDPQHWFIYTAARRMERMELVRLSPKSQRWCDDPRRITSLPPPSARPSDWPFRRVS